MPKRKRGADRPLDDDPRHAVSEIKTAGKNGAKKEEDVKTKVTKGDTTTKVTKGDTTTKVTKGDTTTKVTKGDTTTKVTKGDTTSNESPQYSCWLMKSEPDSRFEKGIDEKFGIEDLKACPDQTACWDGVRNYQARNFMRDQMKIGHKVFFYHSNTKVPGIAGICKVVKESYVDHTQFDGKDPHYDRSATKEKPRWYMVDVKFERMTNRYISLPELKKLHLDHKQNGGPLKNLALFSRARLSVQPVTEALG